ncbi:hypothetical protein M5689_007473 [Euphorbia peplus]|nr:hypothetical protein M5689_007473 [Euphorbia peplus]
MRRRITSSSSERRRSRRKTAHAARATCKKASRLTTIKNDNVSLKLEALKNLIPSNNAETVKPEQLFQETADYIVRLRTQVFILQNLIHIYGSTTPSTTSEQPPDNNNHNLVL